MLSIESIGSCDCSYWSIKIVDMVLEHFFKLVVVGHESYSLICMKTSNAPTWAIVFVELRLPGQHLWVSFANSCQELLAEIAGLEKQRDELEAQLKKVIFISG